MSVINEMLKDLDKNRPPKQAGARYVPPNVLPLRIKMLLVVLSLTVFVLAMWLLLLPKEAANSNAIATKEHQVESVQTLAGPASMAIGTVAVSAPVAPSGAMKSDAENSAMPSTKKHQDLAAVAAQRAKSEETESVPVTESTPEVRSETETAKSEVAEIEALYAELDANLQPELQSEEQLAAELATEAVAKTHPAKKPAQLKIEQIELTPEQVVTQAQKRATTALVRGDAATAEENFILILEQNPRHIEARKQLAALWYGQGRNRDAERLLEQGIATLPREMDFRLLRARLALASNDSNGALAWLAPNPPLRNNLDYYATKAGLAQDLGQYQEAARLYQELLKITPNEARWWMGLGISSEYLQRPQEAVRCYQQALRYGSLAAETQSWLQGRLIELAKQK